MGFYIYIRYMLLNYVILKKTRITLKRKADASIAIRKATWHVNIQRRSSNLDNLAKLIITDLDMINLTPNLILSSEGSLLNHSLWDKDSKRSISSTISCRSELHILKMLKNK